MTLLDRLAACTGADRELDGLIADSCAVALWECCGNGVQSHPEEPPECCGDPVTQAPPLYTASIDAALTLVPEGHDWMITAWTRGDMTEHPGPFFGAVIERYGNNKPVGEGKSGASAAIALVSAALRARGVA